MGRRADRAFSGSGFSRDVLAAIGETSGDSGLHRFGMPGVIAYHAAMNSHPPGPLPVIQLKIERRSNHPWIYQKMVERPEPKPKPGSIVEIVDRNGEYAGRGFYNGHSRITLRVLTADVEEQVDEGFFERKIAAAVSLRRDLLKLDAVTDAYRLIHSEGDGLSGLVVDRFANTLVIEFFSAGMYKQRDVIRRCLLQHYPDAAIYAYAESHVQKQESFDCAVPPTPEPTVIHEHGVKFHAAPGSKHKTGFFVDQRDNRKSRPISSTGCAIFRTTAPRSSTWSFSIRPR